MTKEEQINSVQYAIETLELWWMRYPKRVDEEEIKAMEQLEELIDFMKAQND